MLKDFAKVTVTDDEDLKAKLKAEREHLSASQMKIKEAKLPVMVIFE